MGRIRRSPFVLLAPTKIFKYENDTAALIGLSDKFSLSHSKNAVVSISLASKPEVLSSKLVEEAIDRDHVLKFSVMLQKESISDYLNYAKLRYLEVIDDTMEAKPKKNDGEVAEFKKNAGANFKERNEGGSPRSLFVSSRISRDLDTFASVAAVSSLIAWAPRFSSGYIQNFTTDDVGLITRFRTRTDPVRDIRNEVGLATLRLDETFQKMLSIFQGTGEIEFTQLTRGLTYFIHGLQIQNSPVQEVFWFVSAIEALLGQPSERLTQDQLVSRIRALLYPENADLMVAKFRALYKFRNKFLHGALDVPVWFGGAQFFHSSKEYKIPDWAFEEASDARIITIKVIQKYLELDISTTNFCTVLKD